MRNNCPTGQTCSVTNGGVGVCMIPVCNGDADCSAPRPRCDLAAMPHACVQCLVDTDCKGGFVCDTAMHLCVECTTTKTTNCSAGAAGSRCLATETCGCTMDMDCGDARSGRLCDMMLSKCVFKQTPPPDAGVDTRPAADAARDAVADVRVADATPAIDTRVADAAADAPAAMDAPPAAEAGREAATSPVDAPVAVDAGAGGAGGSPAADAGAAPAGAYLAGGGCKCDLGRRPTAPPGVGVLLGAALLVRRRRRR
jgi:Cys-rich repeat protein